MSIWREPLEKANAEITAKDTSDHGLPHHKCVLGLSYYIVEKEPLKVDGEKLDAIALLHDIGWAMYENPAIKKANPTGEKHMEYSVQLAEPILKKIGFPEHKIKDVLEGILHHDGGKPWADNKKDVSIEIKVVQDADNLEAMGSKGIGRLIVYGDRAGKFLFKLNGDYKNSTIHNIEWHAAILEKRLHTNTAKELARRFLPIMRNYANQYRSQEKFALDCIKR